VVAVKGVCWGGTDPAQVEQVSYSHPPAPHRDSQPVPEAAAYGTEYIQPRPSAAAAQTHPSLSVIVAVFPTLVSVGSVQPGSSLPTSYLTAGLNEVVRWLWLPAGCGLRQPFHFIHARRHRPGLREI